MRKRLLAVVIAVIACLAALAGCGGLRALEKDASVVFEVGGKYVDSVTVNSFNNAIAPVFDESAEGAVPEGYKFMGWSAKADWAYGDSRELLIGSGGIVRYAAVKDFLNEGGTAVAVPVIIDRTTIPRGDLVIAWYDSTNSGISQKNIDDFEAALREYLAAEGYDLSGMDIVIRSYNGNVGTSCGNIRADGDVDIMLGWSSTSNLTGTGSMNPGVDVLENVNGITIGSKTRYSARCSDRELGIKVYGWIQETYGNGSVPEVLQPVAPDPDPEPNPDPDPEPTPDPDPTTPSYTFDAFTGTNLVIGWWDSSSSGLTADIVTKVETALKELLTANGKDVATLTITFKSYAGKVGSAGALILADRDKGEKPDILLGFGGNLTTDTSDGSTGGNLTDLKSDNRIDGVKMGEKTGRYIDLYEDTNDFAVAVWNWFKTADAQALFA